VGHRPRAGEICSAKAESVDQRIAQLMPQEMAQIQRCIATVIAVRQIALKVELHMALVTVVSAKHSLFQCEQAAN